MASAVVGWYLNLLTFLRLSSPVKLVHHSNPAELSREDPSSGKRVTSLSQILDKCPSLKGPLAFFTPTFWLLSGHLSTIYCTLASFDYDKVEYTRHYLRLPDGGTIGVDFTPPITEEDPLDDRPMLVVSHGLSGGSYESYVRDVLSKLNLPPSSGGLGRWRAVVINSRGCANVPVTSAQMYNGAATDDIRCALTYLSRAVPNASLYGVGFSLGAGQMAKAAGEDGARSPFKSVIIVSAPWDYLLGHVKLSSSWIRLVYSRAMAGNMRALVWKHRRMMRSAVDFEALFHNPHQLLFEFDSVATSHMTETKYETAYDYYRDASPCRLADQVAIPMLSLVAMDDPIVAAEGEPRDKASSNPNLVFASVAHGGHLGYFSGAFRPRRWISAPILEWLSAVHEADPNPRPPYETLPGRGEGQTEPKIGDEMVVVKGREDRVGFRLVDAEEVHAGAEEDEDSSKPALTQGL